MNTDTDDLIKQSFKFFENIFSKKLLIQLENEGFRSRKFPPLVTLKGFMYQSLSPSYSCRNALVFILTKFNISVSLKTTVYCRARKKLNTNILKELAVSSGQKISQATQRILCVDGTFFQMWDSKENRKR